MNPRKHAGDLRQVAEEHRRQIDHEAARRTGRDDRQAEQDAVGIGHVDGLRLGRAAGRAEPHVAPHDLDAVVDLAELPNPIVAESPRHSAHQRPLADAAGNGDGHHHVAVQVIGEISANKLHVLAIQLDEPRWSAASAITSANGGCFGFAWAGEPSCGLPSLG